MVKLRVIFLLLFLLWSQSVIRAEEPNTYPEINEKTQNMKKYSGFIPFYWDEAGGKIYLEIRRWDEEFLYLNSLPAGIGSNDIGLDRGQLGSTRIVKFIRSGPKVLLIQPNYRFRAITQNIEEKKAVRDAFAQSVIWGFKAVAQSDGAVLVDATAFFLRDAHGIAGTLKRTRQGNYRVDKSRSAIFRDNTKNFPRNTEVEAIITFTGEPEGRFIRQVTPDPKAVTVRMHHSFVQLPDRQFKSRKFDPRSGFYGISFMDFSTPIGEPLRKSFIARHRLVKKNPSAPMSEAVQPIVYYVDSGAPEPIRSALIEGAGWWNQAFEAAGFKNAFQVKVLPPGVDPLDVRYNVIQWVHRATRGWSYGSSVIDPRTGEIIKGHISLGSQRVRQDYLIAEGLLAPYSEGRKVPPQMLKMALARLRQLAAHEVGHTLGLSHNFAASGHQRASVMDYPHPLVRIDSAGRLDLSDAYAAGIGEWDKVAIRYGYSDIPPAQNETDYLTNILLSAVKKGLYFMTDTDARPPGGAHPFAHLWDNGADAAKELERVLKIRKIALDNFSENNIRIGMPMALLRRVFVPVYLFHRYQTEAAVKILGGLDYRYAVRGDGQLVTAIVSPEKQRKALTVLLSTLRPENLRIPERILAILPPQAYGDNRSREEFSSHTGVTFDPLFAVEAAANLTSGLLLNGQRAARLVEYHARNSQNPGLEEVLDRIVKATWQMPEADGMNGEIQRVVARVILYHLFRLAGDERNSGEVKAVAFSKIKGLNEWMMNRLKSTAKPVWRAHFEFARREIQQFITNPGKFELKPPVEPPPGSPIGEDNFQFILN